MIKATEIMIGDLLSCRSRGDAFCFRVEQVTKHKVGYHAMSCESRMHYLRLNEVQPIPITAELLERNGFRKSCFRDPENKFQWTWWIDTIANMALWIRELKDDTKDGWMICIKSPLSSCCRKIGHVHQLQHAMHLCEFEKKITV